MALVLFSLIKWNIFKFAPTLTFHIIRDITSNATHESVSAMSLEGVSLFKKNLFLISCYYHTTGHVHMQLLFCRLWIQRVNEPRSP